jgi:hypothetical protein
MTEQTPRGRFTLMPEAGQGGLVLALVISVTTLAALALTLVWLNIERTKLAYRVRTLQNEVAQIIDLNAKLSIEREHLLSPHELGKKAERMGLGPAKPGQIRRLQDSETGGNQTPATPSAQEQR